MNPKSKDILKLIISQWLIDNSGILDLPRDVVLKKRIKGRRKVGELYAIKAANGVSGTWGQVIQPGGSGRVLDLAIETPVMYLGRMKNDRAEVLYGEQRIAVDLINLSYKPVCTTETE